MTRTHSVMATLTWLALIACSPGAQQPARVDTRNDACAHCRMTVSNVRFAAQIVAAGEEPRFFDDIGCLRDFLKAGTVPKDATAFVADHRTRAWIVAARAVYVRNEAVSTPMGSHLLAFDGLSSRNADPDGGGTVLAPADVFGKAGPPVKDTTR